MLSTPDSNDLLVIAVGYNDWHGRFLQDFDAVIAVARARGFHHIAWCDLSIVGGIQASRHFRPIELQRDELRSSSKDRVRSLLRGSAVGSRCGCSERDVVVASDGVHETTLGSWGVADWLSRHVAAYDGRPCAQPWTKGGPTESVCPSPDPLAATLGLPEIAGLYPAGAQ